MRLTLSALLLVATACGAQSLPTLPQANDDTPGSLTWVSLTTAVGEAAVEPSAVVAGQALRLVLQVRSVAGESLAGVETVFSVQTDNFADLVRFPEGDRCLSDSQGQCSVVLVSRGGAGAFSLGARIAADPPVVESYPFVVLAQEDTARVTLDIETLGTLEWASGQGDPLAVADRVLFLDVDQPAGRLLRVRLLDGFDNPLSGRNVALEVVQDAPPATDAGPPADSGAIDSGAPSDTGAGDSGLLADTGAAPDAVPGDAGTSDATDGDGGANKVLSLTLDAAPVRLAVSDGSCTPPAEDDPVLNAASAPTDDQGWASFCVQPGTLRAGWSIRINPGGFFTASDGTEHMTLQGRTRAGTPTGLVLVAPAEPGEGEPEPRVTCRAGDFTAVVRFRVVNASGGGVPGVRVLFDTEGGLEGVSPRLRTSDGLGEVSVQAVCPARLLGGGRIVARLAEYEVPPKKLAVEVSAGVVQRVQLMPHGQWPDPVRSGAELSFRVTAFDAEDNKVLRAGLPPSDDQPDTRPPLQFRFSMASVGHAEVLRLAGSNEPLISEVVTIDPELEAADLTVRVVSRATYSNPIQLRAQPVGSEVSDQVSINVAPGDPAHLVVSPAGVVEALLGGAAGELTYTVLDGVDDAANAVPNVPVQITAPQSLVLAANWTNAQTFTGTTGPDGRFRVSVLRANELGDALVTGTLQTEGGPVTATTTVRVGEGSAARLTMTLDGQALPVEEGLPTLTMRAGTALTQSLAIRVLNNQGAGLANRGLSVDLEQRDPTREGDPSAYDPTFDEQNRVTDETGTITFGQGALALSAGGNTGTFIYRLAHGNTPAIARLRIVQVPGPPVIATLTAAEVRSLSNFAQSPGEWTDETSVLVTLRARDANNLAPEGLRMWLEVTNCHTSARAFELDENGESTFRVAGGPTHLDENEVPVDCTLRPRYFNEVDNYVTLAVNGRPAGEGETAEEVAARTHLVLANSGFAAPNLQEVGFGNDTSFVMSRGGTHEWSITADRLQFPNLLADGDCNPASECTTAEIVVMEHADDGTLQVRTVEGDPQVLTADIPLIYDFRDQGNYLVSVRVLDRWLGAGLELGIRLKHPGEDGAVSNVKTFYAHPPMQWTGPGEGGVGGELIITRPDGVEGDVTISGGLRANLDDDEADELLVCGTDDGGGWFAVIHIRENGSLPSESQQAIRSWEGSGYDAPIDNRFACATADMNNDGHNDLVVLAGPQNGFPSFVLHRGTGDSQLFRAQGERMVWNQDLRLRNSSPQAVQLEIGPSAVVVCLDDSLTCQNRKRLLIDVNEQSAVAGGVEFLNAEAVSAYNHSRLGDLIVTPEGSVQNSGLLSHSGQTVDFSPDGLLMATGGYDGTVKLWDWNSLQPIRTLNHDAEVRSVVFSPDNQWVASAGDDGNIRLWRADTGRLVRTINAEVNIARDVAFSPDGSKLAAALETPASAMIWRVETGELLHRLEHGQTVMAVAWSLDGSELVTGGYGAQFQFWNALTGEALRTGGSGQGESYFGFDVSPDGSVLAASISDSRVELWDMSTRNFITVLDNEDGGWNYRSAISPDGKYVLAPLQAGSLPLWSLQTRALVHTDLNFYDWQNRRRQPHGHVSSVMETVFHPSGESFATISSDSPGVGVWTFNGAATATGLVLGDIGLPLPNYQRRAFTYLAAYQGDTIHFKRPYTWRPKCGDGVVDEGELFDNGQPWTGGEFATSCGATCGDGIVQNGEDCDDGNDSNADDCPTTCRAHRCGDAIVRQDVQPDEEGYEFCDDGNIDAYDGCGLDCNRCGDGVVGRFEGCDDGNAVAGDGCTECALDTCGNGQPDQGESCDDGNESNEDACSTKCTAFVCWGNPNSNDVATVDLGGVTRVQCDASAGGGWTLFGSLTNTVDNFEGSRPVGTFDHNDPSDLIYSLRVNRFAELPEFRRFDLLMRYGLNQHYDVVKGPFSLTADGLIYAPPGELGGQHGRLGSGTADGWSPVYCALAGSCLQNGNDYLNFSTDSHYPGHGTVPCGFEMTPGRWERCPEGDNVGIMRYYIRPSQF